MTQHPQPGPHRLGSAVLFLLGFTTSGNGFQLIWTLMVRNIKSEHNNSFIVAVGLLAIRVLEGLRE